MDQPQKTQHAQKGISERDPRTSVILDAAIEVQRELGRGFLEAVYAHALAWELEARGVPFQREFTLPIQYKGRILPVSYRADLLCYGTVLVELKSIARIGAIEEAQLLHYLKATGLPIGLILNFGEVPLGIKRMILSPPSKRLPPV